MPLTLIATWVSDPSRTEKGRERREGREQGGRGALWAWENSGGSFLGSLETLPLRSLSLLPPAPLNRLNAFLLWLVLAPSWEVP